MEGDSVNDEVDTVNDYPFPVTANGPERPEKLYVEAQLKSALEAAYDVQEVKITGRFRTRVVDYTPETGVLRVSREVWDDEEVLRDAGWEVLTSAASDLPSLEEQ